MDAKYIYEVFKTTGEYKLPDLILGLARLQFEKNCPIPNGMTDKGIREFMGRHYNALVTAYKSRDFETFAKAVAECEEKDKQANV